MAGPQVVDLDPGFAALVAQGVALLPAHAPEWTDHNASDPGITLVELLAYFTDALLYRLGRVGANGHLEFLRLLRGDATLAAPGDCGTAAIRAAIDATVDDLSRVDCAVTLADYEHLAMDALATHPLGSGARVRCLASTDLTRDVRDGADARMGTDASHVTVVVFPPTGAAAADEAALLVELIAAVEASLEPRRLLTTWLHVVAPEPLYLGVHIAAYAPPHADREALATAIADSFVSWAPPVEAGVATWTLALTEIGDRAATVDGIGGIDGVHLLQAGTRRETLQDEAAAIGLQIGRRSTVGRDSRLGLLTASDLRLVRDGDGMLAAIALHPWESPHVVVRPQDIVWGDLRPGFEDERR